MRIAIYTRPAWLDPTFPLACALSREDEVHLFVELAPEHECRSLFDAPLEPLKAGIVPALDFLITSDGIPAGLKADLRRLAGFHLVVHTSRRVYHPAAVLTALKAGSLVRAIRPDVIHLDDFTGRILPLVYSTMGIPAVASLHDVEQRIGEASGRFHAIRKIGFNRTSALICHSRHAAGTLKHSVHYRGLTLPAYVIPLGAYTLVRHWENGSVSERDRTVLFWGRISQYKGLEVLWEAAPLVARRVPGVRFVVAGAPVAGYGLPPRPALPNGGEFDLRLRHIANSETCDLFRQCSIVVLPYTDATQSGVVATAFAFERPVVATRVGGLPEMVSPRVTGLLVEPRSAEALAEAIVDLLQHPAVRRSMTLNIRAMKEGELAWLNLARMTREVYKQVAGWS